MSETPDVHVTSTRRSVIQRLSVIWLLPVIALAIALGVAWQSYAERGPLIEVTFGNAEGVAAGETELRYRDVAVGVVEKVGFNKGLSRVQVFIRVDRDVAEYVDDAAAFWIVRPQVTARGSPASAPCCRASISKGFGTAKPRAVRKASRGWTARR